MGRRVQNAHSPCSSNILQIGVLRQGCSWAPIRLCSFIYHKRDLWSKHKSDLTLGNKYVGLSPTNLSLRSSVQRSARNASCILSEYRGFLIWWEVKSINSPSCLGRETALVSASLLGKQKQKQNTIKISQGNLSGHPACLHSWITSVRFLIFLYLSAHCSHRHNSASL